MHQRNSMVSGLGQRENIKKLQKKKKKQEVRRRRRKGGLHADRLASDDSDSAEDEQAQKVKALRFDMTNAQKKLLK